MATGGVFKIITNDGKQDRMMLASELLNKRLLVIEKQRSMNPKIKDPTPTLVDIERTHILFVNAHFKPFVAMGYEYGIVQVQGGQARLGSEVQFNLPQFGDFLNDIVLHVTLAEVTATNADYYTDPSANPAVGAELLAYVDYPGEKLLSYVKWVVNGNPIDEYNGLITEFHRKYFVTPNKVVGWNRGVGQEVAQAGFANVSRILPSATFAGRGAGVRERKFFLDGHQTPKSTQAELDLWIPLIFNFNTDPRLSFPSVAVPQGQRYINVMFTRAEELLQHCHANEEGLDSPATNPVPIPDVTRCELYVNNIFLNTAVHDIYVKRIGFSLIRVYRYQEVRLNTAENEIQLTNFKWPIETIYGGCRPDANFNTANTIMRRGWHQFSALTQRTVVGPAVANSYFFTALAAGVAPTAATLDTAWVAASGRATPGFATVAVGPFTLAQWNTDVAELLINAGFAPMSFPAGTIATPLGAAVTLAVPPAQVYSYYDVCAPLFTRIEIRAHGIPLYRESPLDFYTKYTAYTYGGVHLNTADDIGAFVIPFNLYPRSYQPSGYVNTSRAREFFFVYRSDVIGSTIPTAQLVLVGIAINFMLVSDGSAILRYAT